MSETYTSWAAMLQRCLNPKNQAFPQYGGAGISVCDRWLTFDNFLLDMGERPQNTSIDRIDSRKGYAKENCRWATRAEQQSNIRSNVVVLYKGKKYIMSELAKKLAINFMTLKYRVTAGWPEADWSRPTKKQRPLIVASLDKPR
jgi:hypothetical protein